MPGFYLKPAHYELLGVTISSSAKDIRAAYKKRTLEIHPDKHPDEEQAIGLFQEVSPSN
jgi:curved DNA-binding protein CbpA